MLVSKARLLGSCQAALGVVLSSKSAAKDEKKAPNVVAMNHRSESGGMNAKWNCSIAVTLSQERRGPARRKSVAAGRQGRCTEVSRSR